MADIPEPRDSGSSGTQQPATAEIVPVERVSPLEGLPIAQAVEGLAATRFKSMGGEIAAGLLAASFTQLSYDLQSARQDLLDAQKRLREVETELSETRITSAVLEERVKSINREKHRKNLCLTSGTLLFGIGVEFSRNRLVAVGLTLIAFGVLLVFLGWSFGDGK